MSTIRDIIDLWPSRVEFANDIEVSPQAATNMIARNSIPSRYWKSVVTAASSRGFEVTYEVLADISARSEGAAA